MLSKHLSTLNNYSLGYQRSAELIDLLFYVVSKYYYIILYILLLIFVLVRLEKLYGLFHLATYFIILLASIPKKLSASILSLHHEKEA